MILFAESDKLWCYLSHHSKKHSNQMFTYLSHWFSDKWYNYIWRSSLFWQIKQVIEVLRKENSHTVIVYGDYYNTLLWILRHASELGTSFKPLKNNIKFTKITYKISIINTIIFMNRIWWNFYVKIMSWNWRKLQF